MNAKYSHSLLKGLLSGSADTGQVVCVKVLALPVANITLGPPWARVGLQPLVTAGHKPVSGQDFPTFVLSLATCAFLLFFLILPVCCLFPFSLSSAFQLLPCPFSVLPTRNTLLCSFLLPISVKTHQAFFCLFVFQQGNIFIVDYELLDGVDANKTDPCTIQYLAAPICLLYKNLENKIVPIAIQVGLLSGSLKEHISYYLILNVNDWGFIFFSCLPAWSKAWARKSHIPSFRRHIWLAAGQNLGSLVRFPHPPDSDPSVTDTFSLRGVQHSYVPAAACCASPLQGWFLHEGYVEVGEVFTLSLTNQKLNPVWDGSTSCLARQHTASCCHPGHQTLYMVAVKFSQRICFLSLFIPFYSSWCHTCGSQ